MKCPVECRLCEKEYWDCRKCKVYERYNKPCDFCGRIPAYPFGMSTAKGLVEVFVCEECMRKLV